jgi:hypothetical protein
MQVSSEGSISVLGSPRRRWGSGLVAALLSMHLFLLGGCGSNEPSPRSGLEAEVEAAMSRLPYPFDVLPEYSTPNYIVFRVANPAVNIAYGGKAEGKCPKPPRLPARHYRRGKPFPAAEGLICFEDDGRRSPSQKATLGNRETATAFRIRTATLVAEALCEEVYSGSDSFACFD